ncbi:phage tail assembly chaperone G [Fictibacillus sp. JL2B1089]|uniref:phage tail assembly chaperone G n=1 Tax=Fictibacillus sp. JL2B1089 TaxID=3399565 RepID=UPI003A8AC7BF
MQLTLRINDEKKTFSVDFISGYMFRRAIDLEEKRGKFLKKLIEEGVSAEEQKALLNELYGFIVQIFDKQFTTDEYENGSDARRIVDQSWAIVNGIIGQVSNPLGKLETKSDSDTNNGKK